jgi:hypothetical protein
VVLMRKNLRRHALLAAADQHKWPSLLQQAHINASQPRSRRTDPH